MPLRRLRRSPSRCALAEGVDADAGEVQGAFAHHCRRACGKVECGVWVTVRDGKVVKVEGDESAAKPRALLLEVAVIDAGAISSRPPSFPGEAHEP